MQCIIFSLYLTIHIVKLQIHSLSNGFFIISWPDFSVSSYFWATIVILTWSYEVQICRTAIDEINLEIWIYEINLEVKVCKKIILIHTNILNGAKLFH